jgi:hypothetical protein
MAALWLGLGTGAWPPPAAAADPAVTSAAYTTDAETDQTGIRTVSYSTGKAGHRLKWLPNRPSEAKPSSRVGPHASNERFAQYTAPVRQNADGQGEVDPFADPFGDAEEVSGSSPPRVILHDEVLEGANSKALPSGAVPGIAVDDVEQKSEFAEPRDQTGKSELEELLAAGPGVAEDPCAAVKLKSIREITHDLSLKPDATVPEECVVSKEVVPAPASRGWAPTIFTWKASALCHKPAYFEDVHLERYGHSYGPYVQPLLSGAHFFLAVPVLPYKMGLYPPNECIYSLGYYRPGNCAPYMLDPLPLSVRAGLFQAGVWTGMPFVIP